MIRQYNVSDYDALKKIHAASGLPANCFPNLRSPLNVVSLCATGSKGQVTQAGFIRLTGEAYVLVDHEAGKAQERWQSLQELVAKALASAAQCGIEDCSAWLPPEVEKSFGPRLMDLGWIKSPWPTYSVLLR